MPKNDIPDKPLLLLNIQKYYGVSLYYISILLTNYAGVTNI